MVTSVKPLNILLVEDNRDHAELIQDALLDYNVGNTVVHVEHGEAFIKYLGLERGEKPCSAILPDIIFMDIKMPRVNGIDALRAVKSSPYCAHIPVIMVTTSANDDDIQICYAEGASGYVTKPLQFDQFAKKMRDLNFYWVVTSELPARGSKS